MSEIAQAIMELQYAMERQGLSGRFALAISKDDLLRLDYLASTSASSFDVGEDVRMWQIAGHPIEPSAGEGGE